MQIFKGVASGKQSFREHRTTKWLLEANPRNTSALKISRYTVCEKTDFPGIDWHLRGREYQSVYRYNDVICIYTSKVSFDEHYLMLSWIMGLLWPKVLECP